MGKDVLRLWHPPKEDGSPCDCAYCEIRGDDEEVEKVDSPAAITAQAAYVETTVKPTKRNGHNPLWGTRWADGDIVEYVTESTCQHKFDPGDHHLSGDHRKCLQCKASWGPQVWNTETAVTVREFTQVKNLEDQLKQLAQALTKANTEVKQLREMRGLRSAGTHVHGKPAYVLVEGQNPQDKKIESLERLNREQHDTVIKLQNQARMWRHVFDHPGGTFIEAFGEGPVRYDCPHGTACDRRKPSVAVKAPTKVESIRVKCKACGESDQYSDMVAAHGFTWCKKCWEQHLTVKESQQSPIHQAQQDIVSATTGRPITVSPADEHDGHCNCMMCTDRAKMRKLAHQTSGGEW
jgi:hypothetical protein